MIEILNDIIDRSKILIAKGRVEIFVADRDYGFSWGALAKQRPGAWRGTHVAILTDDGLDSLEEEHTGFAKSGYLYTSRLEPERTNYLNVTDGAGQSGEVRVQARISSDGRAEELTLIRPHRARR